MIEALNGLEGVIVAATSLSDVDGEAGRLIIAGSDVEKLAGATTFEETCGRLLGSPLSLAAGRERAWKLVGHLRDALAMPDAMESLRACSARLETPTAEDLIGALAVFAAAHVRVRKGLAPIAPSPELSHAADYLRMLSGERPMKPLERAMDAYLVTVVDHGMNASTFAARVIASTGSDLGSSVTGAIGALKGPLHGGAPGPVLDMLDAIGSEDRAAAWVEAEVNAGRRIMGMGHRIYRVRDPRAAVLEREIQRLESAGVAKGRLAVARAAERAAETVLAARHPERPLKANVEFYTAVLLDAVGVPRESFSATFAVSRVAGWCAHVAEQRVVARLIRPASRYVGPLPV